MRLYENKLLKQNYEIYLYKIFFTWNDKHKIYLAEAHIADKS